MEQISNQELSKIQAFIDSCDEMINGKFILADIKILKILNMIASSEPLYRYIQECMIDFNFEREYNRSQVKNRINNSNFTPPENKNDLVAMVFALLVEFDKKHIDFYSFINTNFATLTKGGEYENFAKTLLVPFRDIIAEKFLSVNSTPVIEPLRPQDLEPKVEQPEKDQEAQEEQSVEDKIWSNIDVLVDNASSNIIMDRKIKGDNKEQCLYTLKSIKYSFKYKDMRIVSALLLAVETMTVKSHSIKYILNEIKSEIAKYYDLMIN